MAHLHLGSPGGSVVKTPPLALEAWLQSLGQEDSLRKEWQPALHPCLGTMDRGAWRAKVHAVAKGWTMYWAAEQEQLPSLAHPGFSQCFPELRLHLGVASVICNYVFRVKLIWVLLLNPCRSYCYNFMMTFSHFQDSRAFLQLLVTGYQILDCIPGYELVSVSE